MEEEIKVETNKDNNTDNNNIVNDVLRHLAFYYIAPMILLLLSVLVKTKLM